MHSPLQSESEWTDGGKFHIWCSRSTNTQTPLCDLLCDGDRLQRDSRLPASPNKIQGCGSGDSKIFQTQHGFSLFAGLIVADVLCALATTLRVCVCDACICAEHKVKKFLWHRCTRGQPWSRTTWNKLNGIHRISNATATVLPSS